MPLSAEFKIRATNQILNFSDRDLKHGEITKCLSISLPNKPISIPLKQVIITVPIPIPLSLLKSTRERITAITKNEASKHILKRVVLIEYFLLIPFTKKS